MRALLLSLVFVLTLGASAQATQADPQLEALFARLQATKDAGEGEALQQAIWTAWTKTDDLAAARMMAIGIIAMGQDRLDDALSTFDALVEAAPDFAEAWNKRATVHYLMGNLDASVADIEEILASRVGGAVNCYPGTPTDQCHPLAFFVSLQGRAAKGRGHLNFAQMLEEFVKHMQGRCPEKTRYANLITNAWWHDHHEKWYANIETVTRCGVMLEAYLIGMEGRVSSLDI